MRQWSDKLASRYCSTILGRPVRVTYIPSLSQRAKVMGKSHIAYSSRKMPNWVLWHECGHLARGNHKVITMLKRRLPEVSIPHSLKPDVLEGVMREISAHLWAYIRAKDMGRDRTAREIRQSVEDFSGTAVHEASRPILAAILPPQQNGDRSRKHGLNNGI